MPRRQSSDPGITWLQKQQQQHRQQQHRQLQLQERGSIRRRYRLDRVRSTSPLPRLNAERLELATRGINLPQHHSSGGSSSEEGLELRLSRAEVEVAVDDRMRPGHVSLPNGMGLSNREEDPVGTSPNELTSIIAWLSL